MKWDVITIGGGLSGTAFAMSLAKAGARVLLFEKSLQPHHKVCGEFLSEDSLSILNTLGIDPISMGANTQRKIRLVSGHREAVAELPFEAAGFSRFRLDQALMERAADYGVDIQRGFPVNSIEYKDGGISVKVRDKNYLAGSVGYATGKLNIREIKRPLSPFVGFKVMMMLSRDSVQELRNTVQLLAYDGGYQGIQIVEKDQASLCWLVSKSRAKELGTNLNAHLSFLSDQSTLMGDLLSGARTSWKRPLAIAVPHYGFLRREIVHPRLFPLGDQMAVIPSFSGDGMAVALGSGLEAAQSVANGLSAGTYQCSMASSLRTQFIWARVGNSIMLNSLSRFFGIQFAKFAPDFISFLARNTRFRQPSELTIAGSPIFHP